MTNRTYVPRRQYYQLLVEEVHLIQEASKPRLLLLSDTRTPQDLANELWGPIAMRLGVVQDSIMPAPRKGNLWISAIPLPRDA